ncbi:MAG: glycosyl transferase [Bacteroidales bacterium]
MTEHISPNYIFEVSWEVCNKIGGIYTVLSTRAKTLQKSHKDKIIFIGPDVWSEASNPFFIESKTPLQSWEKKAAQEGLNVKVGRWDIPGKPIAILVDFQPFFEQKDDLYSKMWEWYQIESLYGYGDYDEACIFSYASALVIESLYKHIGGESQKVIAHFNEWTTGMGALHVQKKLPIIGTVFTTHATSIGRSIAGNNLPLYDNLKHFNGTEMSHRLNMVAKHSLEKQTARFVDCFTTVSDITAVECEKLLDKPVDVVTPNGFERDFVPKSGLFKLKRDHARHELSSIVEKLTGNKPKENAFFVATGGRYEYKNKGIDLFIDALNRMKESDKLKKEIYAFILVPAHVLEVRKDLLDRWIGTDKKTKPLDQPYITHWLHNMEQDLICNQLKWLNFNNEKSSKVKVIFIPIYLTGSDAIFKESYYDLLIGMDATVFPSYYEPWGYTPLESVAFSIPTITTTLSGFGVWANKKSGSTAIESGVSVIERTDYNQINVSEAIRSDLTKLVNLSEKEMKTIRDNAFELAKEADWDHFIQYYTQAYHIALKNKSDR